MSFVHDLSITDLNRLRAIVKKEHLKHYPAHMITDYEADKLIDAIGPEVAGQLVKQAMDSGKIQ